MAAAAETKIQTAVSTALADFDKSHLRKMQGQFHRCCAKCCDDDKTSMDGVQACINRCEEPLKAVQKYTEGELTNLQNRLNRCASQCADTMRDKIGPYGDNSNMSQHQAEMEACVTKCADEHVALLPQMLKKCREVAEKNAVAK